MDGKWKLVGLVDLGEEHQSMHSIIGGQDMINFITR